MAKNNKKTANPEDKVVTSTPEENVAPVVSVIVTDTNHWKEQVKANVKARIDAYKAEDFKAMSETRKKLQKSVESLNEAEKLEQHKAFLKSEKPLFACIKEGTYKQWKLIDTTNDKGDIVIKVTDVTKKKGIDCNILKQVDVFYLNELSINDFNKSVFDSAIVETHAKALEKTFGLIRALRTGKTIEGDDEEIRTKITKADEHLGKLYEALGVQICTGKMTKTVECPLGKWDETIYTDVETIYGWAFKKSMNNGNLTYEKCGNYRFFVNIAVAMLNSKLNGKSLETVVGKLTY